MCDFEPSHSGGFDDLFSQKYPQYILEVKAADMEGNGFSAKAKVNITVMANNDHAPDFPRSFVSIALITLDEKML